MRPQKLALWIALGLMVVVVVRVGAMPVTLSPHDATLNLIARTLTGEPADARYPDVSENGQWVVFASRLSTITPDDTNTAEDVFLRDRTTGATMLVSKRADGSQGVYGSSYPRIASYGRTVVFASRDALTPDDTTEGENDVYAYEAQSHTLELISVTPTGAPGNHDSTNPIVSADGRYVLFTSYATDLIEPPIPDGYLTLKVFLRDRVAVTTTLISDPDVSMSAYDISGDGRWLLYGNYGKTLYLYDRDTDATVEVGHSYNGAPPNGDVQYGVISEDSEWIAFVSNATNIVTDTTNFIYNIYLYNRLTDTTLLVSRPNEGGEADRDSAAPAISADGRYVAFQSSATTLTEDGSSSYQQVFLYERESDTLQMLSKTADGPGNQDSIAPQISGQGEVIVFESLAGNLVDEPLSTGWYGYEVTGAVPFPTPTPNPTPLPNEIYLPAIVARNGLGDFPRLRVITQGAHGQSGQAVVSGDGSVVAFISTASNLVPNDTNIYSDAFVWTEYNNRIQLVSVSTEGIQASGPVETVELSADGRYVAFVTASSLVSTDTNSVADVYRHDLITDETVLVSVNTGNATVTGASHDVALSADGRWIWFTSEAQLTDVPFPTTCPAAPCVTLYRRDMNTGVTDAPLRDENGFALTPLRYPSVSADGQQVLFAWLKYNGESAEAGPVVRQFIQYYNAASNTLREVTSPIPDYACLMPACNRAATFNPRISGDGQTWLYEAYGGRETTGERSSTTTLTTRHPNSAPMLRTQWEVLDQRRYPNPPIPIEFRPLQAGGLSHDGGVWVFAAEDDLRTHRPAPEITIGTIPSLEDDHNLNGDVYLYDGVYYRRVSDSVSGEQANGDSFDPAVSTDGRVVVFTTAATNLGEVTDSLNFNDIVVWEWAR